MIRAPSHRVAATAHVLLGSFARDDQDGLHRSIRDARAGDQAALDVIREGARRAARRAWPDVGDGLVVPVPGHRAGGASSFVRSIAEAIADSRGWLLAQDGLVRIHDIPEAKSAGPRRETGEASSLAWRRDERGEVVILVDDVLWSGATLQACLAAIREADDGRPVLAMAVARSVTILPGTLARAAHRSGRSSL